MSTYYYELNEPITSIRIETVGPHDRITVWVNSQNAGTLVVNADSGETSEFLRMFSTFGTDRYVCQSYSLGFEEVPGHPDRIGKSKGYGLRCHELSRSRQVVDEYGDLHWLSDIVMEASKLEPGVSATPGDWLAEPAEQDYWTPSRR